MKLILLILFALPYLAFGQSTSTYLCVSEEPRGAIALQLSEGGTSLGRQSHPWTRSWEDLLTGDKDQYNNLNVGFVKELGPDHFTFNASVYRLVNHPEVISQTKSELHKGKLKFFIGYEKYMYMNCRKTKGLK